MPPACTSYNKDCEWCRKIRRGVLIKTKKMAIKKPPTSLTKADNVHCNSKNVVYYIKCERCKTNGYVGQTKLLSKRMKQHRKSIHKKTERVGKHFSIKGHSKDAWDDATFYVLEQLESAATKKEQKAFTVYKKCKAATKLELEDAETSWIDGLNVCEPCGINKSKCAEGTADSSCAKK